MFLSYCADFVPKSFFVRKNIASIDPIHIPFVSDDSCVQVCPCRTTLFYLDVVASRRASHHRTLLLHHSVDNPRSLTPQAVARYIIKLVRWAYSQAGATSPPIRAHDVRKIAASMRALSGESLSDVVFPLHLSQTLFCVGRTGDGGRVAFTMCRRTLNFFLFFAGLKTGRIRVIIDGSREEAVEADVVAGDGRRFPSNGDKKRGSGGRSSEGISHSHPRNPPPSSTS